MILYIVSKITKSKKMKEFGRN